MPELHMWDDLVVQIRDADQIAQWLHGMEIEVGESRRNPHLTMLLLDSGQMCFVGVGGVRTIVAVDRGDNGPYPISVAPSGEGGPSAVDEDGEVDDVVGFGFAGEESEFHIRNTVSIPDGYGAFIYFYESNGLLDERIAWEER